MECFFFLFKGLIQYSICFWNIVSGSCSRRLHSHYPICYDSSFRQGHVSKNKYNQFDRQLVFDRIFHASPELHPFRHWLFSAECLQLSSYQTSKHSWALGDEWESQQWSQWEQTLVLLCWLCLVYVFIPLAHVLIYTRNWRRKRENVKF